jgi:hypothetical protein
MKELSISEIRGKISIQKSEITDFITCFTASFYPFMIPIAKPKAVLPVNGMPRFVDKSDAAAGFPRLLQLLNSILFFPIFNAFFFF